MIQATTPDGVPPNHAGFASVSGRNRQLDRDLVTAVRLPAENEREWVSRRPIAGVSGLEPISENLGSQDHRVAIDGRVVPMERSVSRGSVESEAGGPGAVSTWAVLRAFTLQT